MLGQNESLECTVEELNQQIEEINGTISQLDENSLPEQINQLEETLNLLQELVQLQEEIATLENSTYPLGAPLEEIIEPNDIVQAQQEFKLSKAANVDNSPFKTKYQVMTQMPKPEFLEKLEALNTATSYAVLKWLKEPHSYVVSRPYQENQPSFFPHVAGTALYESYTNSKINGKDHGKKAGSIFNGLKKLFSLIEKELEDLTLFEEDRGIYQEAQALLIAHHNALVLALKKLPSETQDHLAHHAKLNVDTLQEKELTPLKQQRIQEALVFTPSSLIPQAQKITPKQLSEEGKKSVKILKKPSTKNNLFN